LYKKKEIGQAPLINNSVGRNYMQKLSADEINHIRQSANIVDVVRSYIPLEEKGKNFFGVCPFHNDHSPSMSVSKEKQMYKCFSCGAGGNVFKFVADFENVSFIESVKIVADKVGISVNITSFQSDYVEKFQTEYDIMELAHKIFQNNINTEDAKVAKEYLKKRNISDQDIAKFEIGVTFSQNNLSQVLQQKFDLKVIEELGLISIKNNQVYDMFMNRVMFPIHNIHGQVVGFTGRIFQSGNPKYLNSKENAIFKKGKILFNYHRARDTIKLHKKLIIVEGNMDAIRLSIEGVENVVALMGTAITKDQIDIIKKLRVPVVLILDNDEAGLIATDQVGTLLIQENINVTVVRLSGEKDPDDYILKNGIEALKDNIKKAISFMDFKLFYLKRDRNLKDTDELSTYIKEIISSLKNSDDEILKEVTLKKISKEYDLSYDMLKNELDKIKIIPKKQEIETTTIKKDIIAEHILYFMMNGERFITLYNRGLGTFKEKEYRLIASEILYYYENHPGAMIADFLTYAHFSQLKKQILEIVDRINDVEIEETIMIEYITAYKTATNKKQIVELKKALKQELDSNKKMEILIEIQKLKKEV